MNLAILIVIARGLATVPVCALLALATRETDFLALGIFSLAVVSDVVDGRVARARHEVTALGAALDPLADKILIVGTLAALSVRGIVPLWATTIVVARELVAVWVRARAQRPLPATIDGKAKTTMQVVAAAVVMLGSAAGSPALAAAGMVLVVAAVALTIASGVRLVLRAA